MINALRKDIRKPSSPTLQFHPKSSLRLKQVLAGIHSIALFACIAANVPFALKILLVAAIMASSYQHLQPNQQPWQFQYIPQQGWQVLHQGHYQPINILPSTVLSPMAIFLHFKLGKHRHYSQVIAHDALSPVLYRQLLATLKINASQEGV